MAEGWVIGCNKISGDMHALSTLREKGPERLLGKGQLIVRWPEESGLIFAQVPFLSRPQTEEIVKSISSDD